MDSTGVARARTRRKDGGGIEGRSSSIRGLRVIARIHGNDCLSTSRFVIVDMENCEDDVAGIIQ